MQNNQQEGGWGLKLLIIVVAIAGMSKGCDDSGSVFDRQAERAYQQHEDRYGSDYGRFNTRDPYGSEGSVR